MPGKKHTAEQIIHKLREAEVALSSGRVPFKNSNDLQIRWHWVVEPLSGL
jgi:hypothetical protein